MSEKKKRKEKRKQGKTRKKGEVIFGGMDKNRTWTRSLGCSLGVA